MPTESPWGNIEIPNIGIWDLMFENKNRQWPDNQGEHNPTQVLWLMPNAA
jgi:hypothetical protein